MYIASALITFLTENQALYQRHELKDEWYPLAEDHLI